MIFTIIFYIIGFLLGILAGLLPVFSVYPTGALEGFQYAGSALMKMNFIFDMYNFCAAVVFLVQFEAVYLVAHIIIMIVHTIRGNKTIEI